MIAIACDHAAFGLKQEIINHLKERGLSYKDFGAFDQNSCDYSDFAYPAAKSVASGECRFGILMCGTGIGMSICANKVKGIRCALCGDVFSAEATRRHNDANILALGARVTGVGLALRITDAFLDSAFEGGRHQKRIDKITAIEKFEC